MESQPCLMSSIFVLTVDGEDSLPAVARRKTEERHAMLDVFMLVIGIGFFAAAVAYASACDRL
jgi:hypothetical protein